MGSIVLAIIAKKIAEASAAKLKEQAVNKADADTYGTRYLTSGLGQVGETEEKAKKDKNKSNTISKKKYGTRGTTVPLQSTKTISGDGATKGVQI